MNKTSPYDLCIILPVYNEEANMDRLSEALAQYISHASVKSCVLFVNDGSIDQSLQKIKAACCRYPHTFYIGFEKNRGLSAALKAGIDHVFSPYTGYMDADLQTSPEDFELLLPYRCDYDLVTGIRTGRKDPFMKRLSSIVANRFRRMFTHDGIEDTGCPLKIIKTPKAKHIPFFKGMHRFLPALILMQEGTVKQVPVRHFSRIAGKSNFTLWNRLFGPLADCFAYRWMKKRAINYLIDSENIA